MISLADALAELLLTWRRRGVRVALHRHDGTTDGERRLIERYNALVAAEEAAGAA